MLRWRVTILGGVLCGCMFAAGCGRQSTEPPVASGVIPAGNDDQLPFERAAQKSGISPTSSVIPPDANVPAGTSITIRLQSAITSATDRAGDRFVAVLDEPILVNGETVAGRGTVVTGRIVEARPAGHSSSPGYLRLALTSIPIGSKTVAVQTSSSFVKGPRGESGNAARADRAVGSGSLVTAAAGAGKDPVLGTAPNTESRSILALHSKDAIVGPDRRLTFRLTESVPLRPQGQ